MRRRSSRRADTCNAFNTVGMQSSPVQRLLATHGPAINQGQVFDAKMLNHQRVLCGDVIDMSKDRDKGPREWFIKSAGR